MEELTYLLKELNKYPDNRTLTISDLRIIIQDAILEQEYKEENLEKERISDYDDLDHY